MRLTTVAIFIHSSVASIASQGCATHDYPFPRCSFIAPNRNSVTIKQPFLFLLVGLMGLFWDSLKIVLVHEVIFFFFPLPLWSVYPQALTPAKSQPCAFAWIRIPAVPSWALMQAIELAVIAHQSQVWAIDLEASHSYLPGPTVVMRLFLLTSSTTESTLAVCSYPASLLPGLSA